MPEQFVSATTCRTPATRKYGPPPPPPPPFDGGKDGSPGLAQQPARFGLEYRAYRKALEAQAGRGRPGPHQCDVDSDVVEPDDTIHPMSLNRRLVLQLHTKFDDERHSSLKVLDNDADMVHPLIVISRAQGSEFGHVGWPYWADDDAPR